MLIALTTQQGRCTDNYFILFTKLYSNCNRNCNGAYALVFGNIHIILFYHLETEGSIQSNACNITSH